MLRVLTDKRPKLDINNYKIYDLIGSTEYSNVYKSVDETNSNNYVFKFTALIDNDTKDSIIALDIMRIYNLPTLLKNYGYFYFPKYSNIPHFLREGFMGFKKASNFYVILNEYMPNGNLFDYLHLNKKTNKEINHVIRYKIIFGISSTMKNLHSIHLFHRDLKTKHVFLNENFEPIISLCHTSKFLLSENELQTPMIGTPMFIAPEVIKGGKYGLKADVYSFAIIVLNLFTYNIEFLDDSKLSAFNFYKKVAAGERYKRPDSIPDVYWNLIEMCWKQDEKQRPSFDEITEILKGKEFIFGQNYEQDEIDEIRNYQKKFENDSVCIEFSSNMNKMILDHK